MTSSTVGTKNVMLPDLSSVLSQIDFDKQPISHGRQGATKSRFSVAKWGSLIIELIAYPTEEDAILQEFGLTKHQYAELRGNSLFQQVWKETESSIVALASNGGFQLNARRLAEQGLNVLEELMEGADDKERLKAVELTARLANLDPLVQAKTREKDVAVNTGVQLVVNFSEALRVPDGFKKGNQVIIDTVAENTDDERE